MLAKTKIELVVDDPDVEKVIEIICKSGQTGNMAMVRSSYYRSKK